MLQGLKDMKNLLIFTALVFSACGTEKQQIQSESFEPQEITISKTELCENLDASVQEDMDASTLADLCGSEIVCTDFEVELDCTGEWCVTHRNCRLSEDL